MLTEEEINKIVKDYYNYYVDSIKNVKDGSADVWVINEKYVLKYYQKDFDLNKILKAINICQYLYSKKYIVPIYYKCNNDNYFFKYNERYGVLMNYINGDSLEAFKANNNQLINSAHFYANLVIDLSDYPFELPKYNLEKCTLLNLEKTINELDDLINKTSDLNIKKELLLRKTLLMNFDKHFFDDIDKITFCNCHGDYYVSQCLYRNNKIYGILDFDSAKYMPVIIEIIRSYIYLDKKIDIDNLVKYTNEFINLYSLNKYDLKYMPFLYYISLLRSTFGFKQYINDDLKKEEYLKLANKMQFQIKYFQKNIDLLSSKLININK